MASIAIPVVFPAIQIGNEYFGDGCMRESAPLSPALHLGASKLLIISVRNPTIDYADRTHKPVYPNLGNIAGYMFDSLFVDRLDSDIERLQRINFALTQTRRTSFKHEDALLRPIDFLVISPSVDLREIVSKHVKSFPRSMRLMLSALELGYNDGYAQREKIQELLEL